MDSTRFDRMTRLLGASASRRAALVVLIGGGMANLLGSAETPAKDGKKKRRKRQGTQRGKGRDQGRRDGSVAAQAICASPGPSSNLNGCNFNDEDLAGVDLSSSSMGGTKFRRANLCGADLSSSQLKNADFRGADLTRADLHSSGCRGARFNADTVFCQTITCNGSVRNDDCRGVDPDDVCCFASDCGPNRICVEGRCVACDVCLGDNVCAYDSVANAVGEADEGAVIRICPGAYRTVDVPIEKGVTLIGAGTGASGTTLDAEGAARVFRIQTDATDGPVRIEHLTLTGGNAGTSGENSGGAFRVSDDADVTLVGVVVTGNMASNAGGGILSSGTLTLEGSHVTRNTADEGGGIANFGTLTLKAGSRVSGNMAADDGGGIVNSGTLTLQDGSRVTNNEAGNESGGIENGFNGILTLESGSSVTHNTAVNDGGGVLNRGTATLRTNSSVANNEAGSDGGGIRNDGTLTLEADSSIADNTAGENGGGVFNTVMLTLEAGSSVTGNDAADGGGIFNSGGAVTNNGDVSGNTPNQCAGNPAVPNCAS